MAFQEDYPWTSSPLIASAPMRLVAYGPLAVEVSRAGGLGFIGGGTDTNTLEGILEETVSLLKGANLTSHQQNGNSGKESLPIGVGFINWGASLEQAIPVLQKYPPAAVWLFAPKETEDFKKWTGAIKSQVQPEPKIWIQVGTVAEARAVCEQNAPDVLVVQGNDAGGHGLQYSAGIVSLVPEVSDYLKDAKDSGKLTRVPKIVAAGGIIDGRGVAASLALGAQGVTLGTRYLASHEAKIAKGYQQEVLRASDGGQTTVRSSVYDYLRGTADWPKRFGGRGVINASYNDWVNGMDKEENKREYEEAIKQGDSGWGPSGRMTTYAGTGVGLVKHVQSAADITKEVIREAHEILSRIKV